MGDDAPVAVLFQGKAIALTRKHPVHVPLPTKEEVLEFIRTADGKVGKRELARAFSLKGAERAHLAKILKELAESGDVERGHKRRFHEPGTLPDVLVVEVATIDVDGEALARPLTWKDETPPPKIFMISDRMAGAVGIGDRALVRLKATAENEYEARIIRRITAAPAKVLGIFQMGPDGGRIVPTDKKEKAEYVVARGDAGAAEPGALVLAEILPGAKHYGLRRARVFEVLGDISHPKAISEISIRTHGIPADFPADALEQAAAARAAPLSGRTDLRAVPLVTIDGEDARDFDDAVFAEPDSSPDNPGGWHIMVAIADVAWYVRPNDALDKSAYERGNSVYFPDRVVPMLPEALSNGWCSLVPREERPCMAVSLWIDAKGEKLRHKFVRGLMRSAERLTYTQVQNAVDGMPDEATGPLLEPIIKPLYGAYESLKVWRAARGTLELDLPEKQVVVDAAGKVVEVKERPRYDSHRLIEEFMISANVAAAEELEKRKQPCMYRIHDEPAMEKLEALAEFLESLHVKFAKTHVVDAKEFNRIIGKFAGTGESHLVNTVILRSQSQAVYSPENHGHFGLGLRRYAHFTSPIRRYADLLVHRALISGLGLGHGGLPDGAEHVFIEAGEHISATERRAQVAEREAVDRFSAAYLAERIGATFPGRVTGVTRFGLFVSLRDSGADGLIPIRTLPDDYYDHDEARHRLIGRRSGLTFRLGDELDVILAEASPVSGGMLFQLASGGAIARTGGRRPTGKPPAKKRRR